MCYDFRNRYNVYILKRKIKYVCFIKQIKIKIKIKYNLNV